MATVLSAQCTDKRVDKVTPALFRRYRRAKDYARARVADLERLVYSTGYYKTKARYLKGIGKVLEERFGGEVPKGFQELQELPGVSKKSACIIAAKAFRKYYGVAVDTHVARVAPRLGLAPKTQNRDRIARALERLYEPRQYLQVNEYFIMLGREICTPRQPTCSACPVRKWCPSRQDLSPKKSVV